MRPTLWAEVKRVFSDALDVPADRREEFVRRRTDDDAVREEALRLLRRRERMTGFLRAPLVADGVPLGARQPSATLPASESAGADGRGRTSTGVVHGGPLGADAVQLAEGAVLAGRYELGRRLGAGAFGAVHLAKDRLTGQDVAIKVLPLAGPADQQAMRREVAVLRRARLPGVVELLDDGVELGHAFLVMRLVDGRAFPGAAPSGPASWADLGARAIALVEALGRLHWLGVLHRDVKPDNVLVDTAGAVTIVDLGVARDLEGLPDLAGRYLVGTPAYLAPERLGGAPASVATDLYAVGVMLWDLLAGRPLRDVRDIDELIRRRAEPPTPLRDAAPAVPEHVATVVDAMVHPDPSRRPRSARVAAALLRGDGESGARVRLPFVGSDAAVVAVVEAVRARRSIDVVGPPGCGRTRTLEEAARRLEAEGRVVLWARAAAGPFAALRSVLAEPTADGELSLDTLRAALTRRLAVRLRSGAAVFADDWESIDLQSSAALAAAAGAGALVRVFESQSDARPAPDRDGGADRVEPAPRAEVDLRALFHGPDRIFHLREDAARELHRRTAGFPQDVVDRLHAWFDGGIARWEDGLCRIDRAAIERLETRVAQGAPVRGVRDPGLDADARLVQGVLELATSPVGVPTIAEASGLTTWRVECALEQLVRTGLARRTSEGGHDARTAIDATAGWDRAQLCRVHAALAEDCSIATERRLHHLLAADRLRDAAGEATLLARRLVQDGRALTAMMVAHEGLSICRGLDPAEAAALRSELLAGVLDASLAAGTLASLEFAGYVLSSQAEPGSRLLADCAAARAALTGRWADALAVASHDELELGPGARRTIAIRCLAARMSPDRSRERVEVARAARWARHAADGQRELFLEMHAWHLYRCGRFDRAARLHERAAAMRRDTRSRCSGQLNAASAALEAFELDRARRLATAGLALARARRDPHAEIRAGWLLRAADYRGGGSMSPDLEFAAMASAGTVGPNLEGLVLLTEAAIAWRAGMLRTAAELAHSAAEIAARGCRGSLELLGHTLQAACDPGSARQVSTRVAALLAEPHESDTRFQALALIRLADWDAAAAPVPTTPDWNTNSMRRSDVRREVLSMDECCTLLNAHP